MKWIFIIGGGLVAVGVIVLIIYSIVNNQEARFGNSKTQDINYGG